jgi:AraC family transcriptional regulator
MASLAERNAVTWTIGASSPHLAQGGLAGWQVRALTAYVDARLDDKLGLAALAGAVRLSPSYLCRACRQTLDCSPMQFVMQRRLIAARRLLAHSSIALSELALRCGFADQAHFSRVFRAATGESPLRWRREACAASGVAVQSRAELIA